MTAQTSRLIGQAAATPRNGDAAQHSVPDWRHQAECRNEKPELFFPVGSTGPALVQTEQAKAVCARCPVRLQCLDRALETGQEFGVWSGLSEEERRLLKQKGRNRVSGENRRLRPVQIVRQQLGQYLNLAADGLTVKDIAAEMGVMPSTIREVQALVSGREAS